MKRTSPLLSGRHVFGLHFLAGLFGALSCFSQPSATTLTGRVRNGSTGAYLQNADVSVQGTDLRTVTERDGSFTLSRVSAGAQTLVVTYGGLEPYRKALDLRAGQTESLDIMLTSETYRLEEFTVVGQREGNAASIARQKSAENIVNVISMDAHGNVADGNIGNFLQRLPGISAIYEEGEIIGVGMRGIPPNQSAVTVDGGLMTAAVTGAAGAVLGDRAPPIDRLPAEFIKEVEVFKAPTPDRPVTGLGGSANLVTKSAFDFKERVVTYRAGLNHNTYRPGMPYKPTGSFTYMDALGAERRMALTLSSSYARTVNTRDRTQGQRVENDWRLTQARLLNDVTDRVRWGYNAKLEYKIGPATQIGAEMMFSRYTSDFERYNLQSSVGGARRVASYSTVSRAQIEAGTVPRTAANEVAGVAPGFNETFTELLHAGWVNQSAVAGRTGEGYRFGATASTKVAGFDIRARASHSPEKYDRLFRGVTNTMPGIVGIAIDARNRNRPVYTQTYGPPIFGQTDFARYTAEFFDEHDTTKDKVSVAQIDAARPLATHHAITLKTGLMWTEQERRNETYRPRWSIVGRDGVAGLNSATQVNDDNLAQFREPALGYGLFRGLYPQVSFLDFKRVDAALKADSSAFRPVGTTVTTRAPATVIQETVVAGYVMGRLQFHRLTVVGGVRAEDTDVDGRGLLTDARNPASPTIRVTRGYDQLFPSIHFKYEASRNLLLRASYSTSLARPSFSQITPNTTVDYTNEIVQQGNPGLEPQYSKNYDISAEYYFDRVGVVSISAYRKDVSDYIYSSTATIGSGAGNGFNGLYQGFLLRTTGNAGKARISGAEVNYLQPLEFLPKPFDGLTAFANYTRLSSDGSFDGGTSELENYVPRTMNVGLSYKWRRFQARAAIHHQSAYLISFNANAAQRQYTDSNQTVDVNVQYTLRPWLQLFVDGINVFNRWPNIYTGGDSQRVIIGEVYGARVSFGVSGRF